MNRLAGVLIVVCAIMAALAVGARAEVPAGPRLTFMRTTYARFELLTANPAGEDRRLIAGGSARARPLPLPFSPPTWSSDGTHVFFSGFTPARSKGQLNLYEATAEGSDLTKLPHTTGGFNPVLSPDGRTLAFAVERRRVGKRAHRGEVTTFRSISTWLLDLGDGTVRQLSPWRNELFEYPASFSPDGTTLAVSWRRDREHRPSLFKALAVTLDETGSTLLARGVAEPTYSPDGTRLALIVIGKTRTFENKSGTTTITYTDLAVANTNGSGLTKLTHSKAIEVKPSWDPSGQRLAYTRLQANSSEEDFLGFGDSIMEVNANGSCQTRVLSYPNAVLAGAAWQPGPGRDAGPIAC